MKKIVVTMLLCLSSLASQPVHAGLFRKILNEVVVAPLEDVQRRSDGFEAAKENMGKINLQNQTHICKSEGNASIPIRFSANSSGETILVGSQNIFEKISIRVQRESVADENINLLESCLCNSNDFNEQFGLELIKMTNLGKPRLTGLQISEREIHFNCATIVGIVFGR